MPLTPEVQQQLLEQAAAKKRGEQATFGTNAPKSPPFWEDVRKAGFLPTEDAAQRMVDLEMVFGQQAAALGANLRAMLAILGQLQHTRMEVFGQGPTAAERAFSTQASTFGMSVGPDGFLQRKPAPPSPSQDGGQRDDESSR